MKILVTGIGGGLGRFLHLSLSTDGLGRQDGIPEHEYDAIIHCAVNSKKNISTNDLAGYFYDNVFLTERLLSVKCSKFIYISTIDVYPDVSEDHGEDYDEDFIRWETHNSKIDMYSVSKLASESLVIQSNNWIVLRCSTLLHEFFRKNTIAKIAEDLNPEVFVHKKSRYNCVLGSDIAKFVELVLKKDIQGAYNICSSSCMGVQDIAAMFNKNVTFGSYLYEPRRVSNRKVCSITDVFNKSTEQCLSQFYGK